MIIPILILLVNLTAISCYTWDTTTPYAKFYIVNGSKATQNDRQGKLWYLLTSKQTLSENVSKVTLRINTYGQPGSPYNVALNLGLTTSSNKQKVSVLHDLQSLQYLLIYNLTAASVCIDARCPTQYAKQLFIPQGQTLQIQVQKQSLTGYFYIPSKKLRYPFNLTQNLWWNKQIYVFFQSNNLGAQVQFLN